MNKKQLSELEKTVIADCFNCRKKKLFFDLVIVDTINFNARCCDSPDYTIGTYEGTEICTTCKKEKDSWTTCDNCNAPICYDCSETSIDESGKYKYLCSVCDSQLSPPKRGGL